MANEYYGGKDVRADVEAAEDEVIVRLENIHKTYLLGVEGVPALRGVSMSIRKGEFVCIFGLSGGGKTTLMNIIGTIDTPTKGINPSTTDDVLSYLRLKKMSAVLTQTFNLLSSLTALENVEMPMILAGEIDIFKRKKRAAELLTQVGMGSRLDHLPSMLSGGEQQRVTIARAIANQPDILLLDEPTGDLDSMNTCIVIKLLLELNKKHGITLVMVTHDVGLKSFADRVIWMRDGKIQNLEIISDETKKRRMAQLEAEHDASVKGSKKKLVSFQNTIVRMPTDYDTHPKHNPVDPRKYDFDENYKNKISMSLDEYESAINLKGSRTSQSKYSDTADESKRAIEESLGDDLFPPSAIAPKTNSVLLEDTDLL